LVELWHQKSHYSRLPPTSSRIMKRDSVHFICMDSCPSVPGLHVRNIVFSHFGSLAYLSFLLDFL
jgi:hypothetical protein